MSRSLEKTVIEQIRSYGMINEGDKVIIGVSGGMDSICLLHILNKLSTQWRFEIFVVHVNHMLRGAEAERDKNFVKDFCKNINVPCVAVNTDVESIAKNKKMSVEEAGRYARYKAFEAAALKLSAKSKYGDIKIALAHHRDDNVETVLLNLIRGSGLNGIKGIIPVNKRGSLTIIRPLIGVGRDEIEEYINTNSIPYVTDSTNYGDDYARNKIRLNVMPELKKVNSRASRHISETAAFMYQIQAYMDAQTEAAMRAAVDRREDSIAISCDKLKNEDIAIQTGIIYKCIALMAGTLKDITHVHVYDCLSLADKQTGRYIELPYGLKAYKSYGNILIRKDKAAQDADRKDYEGQPIHMLMDRHVNIDIGEIVAFGGKTFILADGGTISFAVIDVNDTNRAELTEKNIYKKAFDCDTIKGSLILGRPSPDDDIRFSGGRKTLKKYFTDEKIPWEIRNRLLVLKDLNSTLWVIGYRIGEPYKVTDRTVRALVVTITGGDNERDRSID